MDYTESSAEFWKGCFDKRRHPSRRHARGAIRILRRDAPRENDWTLRAYKCKCGFWHIGHNRFAMKES